MENGGRTMPDNAIETAEFEAAKMDYVRRHAGDECYVMLDGHMSNSPHRTWQFEDAKAVMNAVEEYDLFFFEEPLHYNDISGYSDLCRNTSVPIAGGECLTVFSDWIPFLEKEAFDIAQPDASFVGGLDEFMGIASEFANRGKKIATHAWGAGGSLPRGNSAVDDQDLSRNKGSFVGGQQHCGTDGFVPFPDSAEHAL